MSRRSSRSNSIDSDISRKNSIDSRSYSFDNLSIDSGKMSSNNSFETIEEYYVDECAKVYDNGHGRLIVGKHQVIGGIATLQSEFPDESNTKAEIKAWYDMRSILYDDNETKAELLSRIVENFGAKHIKK